MLPRSRCCWRPRQRRGETFNEVAVVGVLANDLDNVATAAAVVDVLAIDVEKLSTKTPLLTLRIVHENQ
jgi:hypothetical protein